MKAVYDEQADRLASERGAVLTCVSEQENLTRQLHLLHEANKRLHDTNDDLRSALDVSLEVVVVVVVVVGVFSWSGLLV